MRIVLSILARSVAHIPRHHITRFVQIKSGSALWRGKIDASRESKVRFEVSRVTAITANFLESLMPVDGDGLCAYDGAILVENGATFERGKERVSPRAVAARILLTFDPAGRRFLSAAVDTDLSVGHIPVAVFTLHIIFGITVILCLET